MIQEVPSTQYEVRSTKYGERSEPPDARNPEGASAEAFALSGFPLLPKLQDPEGPGLPVKARYRLSVVPALSVSCLTASSRNVDQPHPPSKPQPYIVFATTNPNFANQEVPSTQYQYSVRDTKYEVRVSEANPQTRETPRERLPKRSPSRDSLSYRNSKIPKDPVSR